jgi:hypothetical protein
LEGFTLIGPCSVLFKVKQKQKINKKNDLIRMENKLTHWKEQYNYDFLGAYSLQPGEERTLTIKETKTQKVKTQDGEKECFVAHFMEKEKPMILNRTNCKIIAKVYNTPYIENWEGIKITVYATQVKAFGETMDALRVKNTNPSVDQLAEIVKLYNDKKAHIKPEQSAGVERVIANKEQKSYNKTITFLKSISNG